MQKLKYEVLKKMMQSRLTSAELNLLVYISHFQSDRGRVTGVYYKSVCEGLNISYQTFYDALYGLEQKDLIMVRKDSYYDWDVLIKNNDFTYEDAEKEAYLSTGHDLFHDNRFYALKVNEKLLAMYVIMIAGAGKRSYCIGRTKFYDKFTGIFGIQKRVLQGYLRSLKQFFAIGIKKANYWITPLKEVYKKKSATDKKIYADHLTRTVFRRNRVKYTDKTFRETAELIGQYAGSVGSAIQSYIGQAVEKSLYQRNEYQSNPYKWKRDIYPAFVHKLLRENIYGTES